MILRLAVDLAIGFTSNQAERDVHPVKVQQRTSRGTWRTLLGLVDFAIVQSYLSTTGQMGNRRTRCSHSPGCSPADRLPPATAPP